VPWALGARLAPAAVTPLDGAADTAGLARLFDDRAATALDTRGRPTRFRLDFEQPVLVDHVGVYGGAAGQLGAAVEGPDGPTEVLPATPSERTIL